jgi:NTP pyrophosphatase (non-canonical NTP hydrolase)
LDDRELVLSEKGMGEKVTFDEYQELTRETAIYGDSIARIAEPGTPAYKMLCVSYAALGMGECGETQGKIKKIIRDSGGVVTDEARAAIAKELGDQLWYIAAVAREFDLLLGAVAHANIGKLMSRKERGVLQGSGDNR